MPTSGSSSRSRAIRCSADRPCRPNASRSPRTSCNRLSAPHPAERGAPLATRTSPVWQGSSRVAASVDAPVVVQLVDVSGPDLDLGDAGVAQSTPSLAAVLLSGKAHRRRLHPHRQVLGHDVTSRPSARLSATARMRVSLSPSRNPAGSIGVGVVELHPQGAARSPIGIGVVEPTVLDPQVVEQAERRAGEVAQLGVVPLALAAR